MKRVLLSLALTVALAAPCVASRTLTDETGRKVVVPDHPHRVICLMPSVTDVVFSLGADDDVVAISDYTKYPAAALKKPSVGDLIKPSIEMILSLHPDLVIGMQPKGTNGGNRSTGTGWHSNLSRRPTRHRRNISLRRKYRAGIEPNDASRCVDSHAGAASRRRAGADQRPAHTKGFHADLV